MSFVPAAAYVEAEQLAATGPVGVLVLTAAGAVLLNLVLRLGLYLVDAIIARGSGRKRAFPGGRHPLAASSWLRARDMM